MRARHLSVVDQVTDVQIRVRLDAAGGAHRGDARGQIQARRRERQLGDEESRRGNLVVLIEIDRCRVHQMVVHPDQSRHHAAPGEVDHARAIRRRAIADRFDLAVAQHDRAVVLRRRTGAVDDAHMRKRDDGIVIGDEFLHLGRGRLRERARANKRQRKRKTADDVHGLLPSSISRQYGRMVGTDPTGHLRGSYLAKSHARCLRLAQFWSSVTIWMQPLTLHLTPTHALHRIDFMRRNAHFPEQTRTTWPA